MTTAGRLCRAHLRPLFVPAVSGSPVPVMKRAYDVLGTVATVLVLNFTATPFMLLTVRDSLEAWSRLGWYGVWMVGGALVFFYAGGARVLKTVQGMRPPPLPPVVDDAKREGSMTPGAVFQVPPPLDQVVPPKGT